MTTATREQFGRWSPGAPGRARRQREIFLAADGIRRALVRTFNAQRRWLAVNWRQVASPRQARRLARLEKQDITRWGQWADEIVLELQGPLGRALFLGGQQAITELGVAIDWSLASPEAQDYIRRRGLSLAKGLNRTTTLRLRRVINNGLELGKSLPQIETDLQGAMRQMTPARARVIAQTEVIAASANGAHQVYEKADIEGKSWINNRPNADDICKRLHGQIVALSDFFSDPGTGVEYRSPPAHPG